MFERMIEPWKMALAPYILQWCNWKSIHIIAWHANKTSELCFMFKSTKSNNFNLIYSPTLSKGKSNMHGSNKCDHHLSPSQILPRSITNNLMPNCKLDEWWYIWGFFAKKSKNASCSLTALTHEYTGKNEYFIEVRKCILTKGNTVGLKGEVFAHSLGDTLL